MGLRPTTEVIAEALFTQTQVNVLGLLFGDPARSFTGSELVRAAGKGVGAVHRELARLVFAGLATSTRVGRQRHYRANPESAVFQELVGIMAKLSSSPTPAGAVAETEAAYTVGGGIHVSRKSLETLCRRHHLRQLSLFGSITRRDFAPDSDIDVLVEFEEGKAPGMGGILELHDDLSRLFGGRKVDVATPAILNNPYRRKSIEQDLRTLYAAE